MYKIIFNLLLAFTLMFSLAACDDEYVENDFSEDESLSSEDGFFANISDESEIESEASSGSWAMYWYLCGSDLESEYGAATEDLFEMMDVYLPENVTVVIETGGAYGWQNDFVSADVTQRYVYDSEGLSLVDEQPLSNMGDPETFINFLTFAEENYPADNTIVNFWNHGGGSVDGVAFDENFYMDAITLDELEYSLKTVYGEMPEEKPFSIVGFDTCLMSTIDTAAVMKNYGDYMVASQDLEPGIGWNYYGFLNELAENPQISSLDLSIAICDTYQEACDDYWLGDDITLSVVNLNKINELLHAYEFFAAEALMYAIDEPTFFNHFAHAANSAQNYGGNTREQGYTNMVDLGDLAYYASDILPISSQAVIEALDSCVEYKINGYYREDSTGLACYFPYSGDVDNLYQFSEITASEGFDYYYTYNLTGDISIDDAFSYLDTVINSDLDTEIIVEEYPEDFIVETLPSVLELGWEDYPVYVDDDGFAVLDLGPEAYDLLASIAVDLYYIDEEYDLILSLGTDNDIDADWDNGVFKDNFRGVWGSIDGYLCYMEIVYEGENYNEYSVPILLNGEEYNLTVYYDYDVEEYMIGTATKPISEFGVPDRAGRNLEIGDEIQTLHYATTISGDDDVFEEVPIDTIIVTEETAFYETDLGDGLFVMMFLMTDSLADVYSSSVFTFEIIDGDIYTSVE